MKICDWMINSFTANVNEGNVTRQEELLQISHDEESKSYFDTVGYMQLGKIRRCQISILTCENKC